MRRSARHSEAVVPRANLVACVGGKVMLFFHFWQRYPKARKVVGNYERGQLSEGIVGV